MARSKDSEQDINIQATAGQANTDNTEDKKTLEDIESRVNALLEEAKKSADSIIENAKRTAAEITGNGKAVRSSLPVQSEREKYMQELVEVELFKDNEKYKDDVFVGINGRSYLIQRGKKVLVPRYVKEVLDNAASQGRDASNYMYGMQAKWEASNMGG